MGVVQLSKVTIIAPRSDYTEVAKRLAEFREFHPVEDKQPVFDSQVQELDVRAVKLFAQSDQLVKDLSVVAEPGMLDIIFRGARIPKSEYEAKNWNELLGKAETTIEPIAAEVKEERTRLAALLKEEGEAAALISILSTVSGISADVGRLSQLKRMRAVLAVCPTEALPELRKSFEDLVFISQAVSQSRSVMLVAAPIGDTQRVDKTLKALEIKPISIPDNLPQTPAAAFAELNKDLEKTRKERLDSEARLAEARSRHSSSILAVRELSELARDMLDDVRMAGNLKNFAVIAGYIPSNREGDFGAKFGSWIVHHEKIERFKEHGEHGLPTLLNNSGLLKPFETITREQGLPGRHELDPTPIVTLVFPIFFGMMFGDLGHGVIVAAFAFLIRTRAKDKPGLRQWGNIFLAAGISSCFFGLLFGEVFGFDLGGLVPIPKAVELVSRPVGGQATLDVTGTTTILVIALLIGMAHIITGLVLDIAQTAKAHETIELVVEKIPTLAMYLSGIGFGLSFIGAGYSFNVLKTSAPAPLLGIPNSTLGFASILTVLVAMLILGFGKGVAILAGKIQGESAGSAFANGGIELFVRISEFLANTISYARLAILLFVHAALLLAVNQLAAFPLYVAVLPIAIFNILIILLEGLIVYIQDLRLHIYEFFTKFYEGEGTPFRRIFPERTRIKVNWN